MLQIIDFLQQSLTLDRDAVMAFVQFIPLIISAASAAYGAIKEGQKRREQKRQLGKLGSENSSLFNRDYYQDYTQSAEAQNVIRQARQLFDRQAKRDTNSAVITGATIESQAAGKEARNLAMSNLLANLGAQGTRRKEHALDRYLGRNAQIQGLQYNSLENQAQSAGNITQDGISSIANTDWASILGKGIASGKALNSNYGANIKPAATPLLNVSPTKNVGGIKITNPLK